MLAAKIPKDVGISHGRVRSISRDDECMLLVLPRVVVLLVRVHYHILGYNIRLSSKGIFYYSKIESKSPHRIETRKNGETVA